MKTLHVQGRATMHEAINQFALNDQPGEAMNNVANNQEQTMIFQGLAEAKKGEIVTHDDLWNDLLEK